MDITPQIREFVTSNFYVPNPAELTDDASLLERGIIDSTGVMEVIAFIEDKYAVKVEDEEMVPENLDSIARISAFVARKKA
jgi:acyl carrier protein